MDRRDGEPDWTFEAWEWLLRKELGLPTVEPAWLDLPAMMSIRLSTPHMLKRFRKLSRPYSFVLSPLIDSIAGYPAGIDRQQFTLIAPFTKNRRAWLNADFINKHDGLHYSLAFIQTPRFDKVIPQTFAYILRLYLRHPESKSLGPDGSASTGATKGLLQRMHVVASRVRYIGKETDRQWERGEDFSLLTFRPAQFDGIGTMAKAGPDLIQRAKDVPIKEIARRVDVDRNTIRKMLRGERVRQTVLARISSALD